MDCVQAKRNIGVEPSLPAIALCSFFVLRFCGCRTNESNQCRTSNMMPSFGKPHGRSTTKCTHPTNGHLTASMKPSGTPRSNTGRRSALPSRPGRSSLRRVYNYRCQCWRYERRYRRQQAVRCGSDQATRTRQRSGAATFDAGQGMSDLTTDVRSMAREAVVDSHRP